MGIFHLSFLNMSLFQYLESLIMFHYLECLCFVILVTYITSEPVNRKIVRGILSLFELLSSDDLSQSICPARTLRYFAMNHIF